GSHADQTLLEKMAARHRLGLDETRSRSELFHDRSEYRDVLQLYRWSSLLGMDGQAARYLRCALRHQTIDGVSPANRRGAQPDENELDHEQTGRHKSRTDVPQTDVNPESEDIQTASAVEILGD